MGYEADEARYGGAMPYRRCGRSGLLLPAISLGLWQNFGGVDVFETGRALLRRAFDRGVTHFDLANNYGPPYGSAESNFGRWLAEDFRPYRDELIVSSKAGYGMWPGPYGGPSGSRKYIIASADQSLRRTGLDYFDIFYSHRMDEATPLEETAGALAQLHRQGKALYIGISSYTAERTRAIGDILRAEGVPLLIHQPRYSLLERGIEGELLDTLEERGIGCIVFSPLAQGLLTDKYLHGIPADARAARGGSLSPSALSPERAEVLRKLAAVARERGQSLAQMAVTWVLRSPRVTSALVGARTLEQLDELLDATSGAPLSEEELRRIEEALAAA
ncbi:aldo/keto reductase [Roseomonas elaeocarpi]|uniref:Aldo/keto reductase n=1 Tax=Roseomonas elaeocarpi TaxID=907779 RepID=A0ABV6JTF5_9PROT